MAEMVISRRAYLLSKPSELVMCAAGMACSEAAIRQRTEVQAKKQHAALMARARQA